MIHCIKCVITMNGREIAIQIRVSLRRKHLFHRIIHLLRRIVHHIILTRVGGLSGQIGRLIEVHIVIIVVIRSVLNRRIGEICIHIIVVIGGNRIQLTIWHWILILREWIGIAIGTVHLFILRHGGLWIGEIGIDGHGRVRIHVVKVLNAIILACIICIEWRIIERIGLIQEGRI